MFNLAKIRYRIRIREFVRRVLHQAQLMNNVVIMYQTSNLDTWPEMADPKFREAVLHQFQGHHSLAVRFSPPDEYDDWTFYAERKKP